MREIKFRGKRVDNGEWVYGWYREFIVPDCWRGCYFKQPINYYIDNKNTNESSLVNPDTVGQFTRLKDKNGKKIYEGDIVRAYGGEYCQGFWEFSRTVVVTDLFGDAYEIVHYEYLEVVGNVHDNPELVG